LSIPAVSTFSSTPTWPESSSNATSPDKVSYVKYSTKATASTQYSTSAATFSPVGGHSWHSCEPAGLLNPWLHTPHRLLS
jgi:hypothetical protein